MSSISRQKIAGRASYAQAKSSSEVTMKAFNLINTTNHIHVSTLICKSIVFAQSLDLEITNFACCVTRAISILPTRGGDGPLRISQRIDRSSAFWNWSSRQSSCCDLMLLMLIYRMGWSAVSKCALTFSRYFLLLKKCQNYVKKFKKLKDVSKQLTNTSQTIQL